MVITGNYPVITFTGNYHLNYLPIYTSSELKTTPKHAHIVVGRTVKTSAWSVRRCSISAIEPILDLILITLRGVVSMEVAHYLVDCRVAAFTVVVV